MTNPPDADGSRCPRAEPGPGVVLVCQSCDHVAEPSVADLGDGPVMCTRCGGWTTIAELTEPDPATSRAQHTGSAPSSSAVTAQETAPSTPSHDPITSPDTRLRAGEVPSGWLQITETMSASALLALREKVTERGIDPHDLDAVRAVWEEPEPTVLVTRYAVSIIPPQDPSARHFMITVERRAPIQAGGPWTWAVCHDGYSLTTSGHWAPDHLSPHSATQRYPDLDEALTLAKSWAPRVGTITYTAAQWLTRRAGNNA